MVEEGRGCFGLRPLLFPVAGEDAEERGRGMEEVRREGGEGGRGEEGGRGGGRVEGGEWRGQEEGRDEMERLGK